MASPVKLLGQQKPLNLSLRRWAGGEDEWGPVSAHFGLEVAWAVEGWLRYRIGRLELVAPPGALVVIPEGVEHASLLGPRVLGRALHLGSHLLESLQDDLGLRTIASGLQPGVVLVGGRLQAQQLLSNLEAEGCSTEMMDELGLALAMDVLRIRTRDESLAETHDRRIVAAIERLWDEGNADLGVEDLAVAAGMSRFHFSRIFKQRTGMSPYQYLLELRLQRSAALITRGLPVTQAATLAGFSDMSRFAQRFRRRFDCPPSAYRARAE
ncbi:MAG: helix-turn-helix transcriptional regulator [Deltaproteobacteria bacterium]|nr:helix-turn-helix transcriptional regulator [Deltaproteobacteria bacterium]